MPDTLITYSAENVHILAVQLQGFLCQATSLLLRLARHAVMPDEPSVHLRLSEGVEELSGLPNNEEGYVLSIGSEQGAVVVGQTLAGLRYGAQSLLQLLLPPVALGPTPQLRLPAVHIVDVPRFRWRGVMVDTGRHFFSVDFLRRVLDLMLFYKLNTLHWHLCEDQARKGWVGRHVPGGKEQAGEGPFGRGRRVLLLVLQRQAFSWGRGNSATPSSKGLDTICHLLTDYCYVIGLAGLAAGGAAVSAAHRVWGLAGGGRWGKGQGGW